MAKKKVYAIKEGFDSINNQRVQNKLVNSWPECQKYIKGVKGAIYKSFEDIEEAKSFLEKGSELLRKGKDEYDEDCLHVYVDGSYNSHTHRYSYGVVAVNKDVVEYINSSSGTNDKDNNIRQIAGELNAAVDGVEYALNNNHKKIVLFHDYEGICHHATGFWQRKDESSKKYYEKMNLLMNKGIEVVFVQVKSHQEDLFNEMADTICKKELGIDNDRVLEKYLVKNKIVVSDKDIKEKLDKLVTRGQENIVIENADLETSPKKSGKKLVNKKSINENSLEKDDITSDISKEEIENKEQREIIIEQIDEILEVLSKERLEEVLRYVKRKKKAK